MLQALKVHFNSILQDNPRRFKRKALNQKHISLALGTYFELGYRLALKLLKAAKH